MRFTVLDVNSDMPHKRGEMFLMRDAWDDFSYKTAFDLYYCNSDGTLSKVGWVKIAYKGMEKGAVFDKIPRTFSHLEDNYYSLGQSVDYYDKLRSIKDDVREEALRALNDVAFNLDLLRLNLTEEAMRTSLMRDLSRSSVTEQFHRVALGGAPLTRYNFTYMSNQTNDASEDITLSFSVKPSSTPPTNIHAIIGTNGTGKTTLVKDIISTVYELDGSRGWFFYGNKNSGGEKFANVVAVAFSPFDSFAEINRRVENCETKQKIPYTFIGLDREEECLSTSILSQFTESLKQCKANPYKRQLWIDSIEYLKSDSVFASLDTDSLVSEENEASCEDLFSSLSSGHKVVLLIITCCVAHIAEKSLVIMDEPENHLHPPLLSALIRSLSFLLIDRNGVAILSTHSPVVLQEIPQSCVWKIRRLGDKRIAERPAIQTFGANAGTLISEIFGLEVTKSGFHQMVEKAVEKAESFDDVESAFDHQLGDEALILARALLAIKHKGECNE